MAASNEELSEQVKIVLNALEGLQYRLDTVRGKRVYDVAIGWIRNFPAQVDTALKDRLFTAIKTAFSVDDVSIITSIERVPAPQIITNNTRKVAKTDEDRFRDLLPRGGWFEWYDKYTLHTESPLSYHIMSSLALLGACLGRRLYIDMDFFRVYPNMSCILVGPTGLVKKTSAIDVAKDFIVSEAVCPISVEQVTPSRFISLLARDGGWQFIYLPEVSNVFTKEKFNEGFTTKIIRLLDSPPEYKAETQIRGDEVVTNIALTILGGTTQDQIVSSMPKEVMQSGFMNRFLWVVENDTDRVIPRPRKGPHESDIIRTIKRFKSIKGRDIRFDQKSDDYYQQWYVARKEQFRQCTDVRTLRCTQRGDIHFLRMAMLITIAEYDELTLRVEAMETSAKLLKYIEDRVPQMVNCIDQVQSNQEHDFVLEVLKKLGGAADHSTLLRRVAFKIGTADRFKAHMRTLEEQGLVKVSKRGVATFYLLQEQQHDETTKASA